MGSEIPMVTNHANFVSSQYTMQSMSIIQMSDVVYDKRHTVVAYYRFPGNIYNTTLSVSDINGHPDGAQ